MKAGKRAAKFEDKMNGKEECRITEGMLERKEKKTIEKKERERERNIIRETGMPVKKWKD
jgi:hypothetical protein